jgi:cytochrome P450
MVQPLSNHDPYTDEALLDPWPGYKQMRDAGPAVWLPKYEMFALTRYESVRRALEDWQSFPSRYGVMMNDRMNQVLLGNTLCSDGADHDALRDVLVRPLTPRALRPLRDQITTEAEGVVEKLVEQGGFDAVTELANHLPVTVVSNLVGLPEKGRERMLIWADELFNCFGPINDRTIASFSVLDEMMHYATNEAVPDKLKPGGWAMGIHDAAARGEVPAQACPAMMIDYMGPSLDTTIFAITNAVWLFAKPRPVGPGARGPAADTKRHQRSTALRRADPGLLSLRRPGRGHGRRVAARRLARHRVLWRRKPRRA